MWLEEHIQHIGIKMVNKEKELKRQKVVRSWERKERTTWYADRIFARKKKRYLAEGEERMDVPKILLVDDDPALLQGLSRTLSIHIQGIKVDLAASAFDALERIQRCDYDAIVSDIMMPGLNGLELLTRIKVLRPSTPTLLITGHLEPALLQKAMNAGAYDFIQKPVDRLLLVGALKRALQTRQLQQKVLQQQDLLKDYARIIEPLVNQNVPSMQRSLQPVNKSATPFQPPSWLL